MFLSYPKASSAAFRDNQPASVAVGQPDMFSNLENQGLITFPADADTLAEPGGIAVCDGNLCIADYYNNRVLFYDGIPTSDNWAAETVIGQHGFLLNYQNQHPPGESPWFPLADTENRPDDVVFYGGKMLVADTSNNRIVVFNSIPVTDGPDADLVIGQFALQSDYFPNMPFLTPANNNLNEPRSITIYNGKLLIADRFNHRVLIYDSIPTTNGEAADVVIGQLHFWTNQTNQGLPQSLANTLHGPTGVFVDSNGKLFITDTNNNRLLIYNSIPTVNNASADVVVGQTHFTAADPNQGIGVPSASTLYKPFGAVYSDGTRLFIPDSTNNRVLIYDSIPAANGASADTVLGQPDMSSYYANQIDPDPDPNNPPPCHARAMYWPDGVLLSGTKLFISDTHNSRALIFDEDAAATPTPSTTPTPTPPDYKTPTPTPTPFGYKSPTPTVTPTATPTSSPTPTPPPTATPTPSPTPFDFKTPSPTPTPFGYKSPTPTVTPSPTATPTATPSPSPTATPSPSPTPVDYLTPTPTVTPTPTPTPSPTPTPTPTPNYCVPPLLVSDLEDGWLAQTRSDLGNGFAWRFRHAEYPGESSQDFGYVLDFGNSFVDLNSNTDAPVLLDIYENSRPVDVEAGDYVTIEYDGGQTLNIYPPALSGVDGRFYVALNGSTYTDRELCNLAKAAPTPSPTLTPVKTPTPTPTVSPTTTPSPSPTPSPTPDGYETPTPTPTVTPSATPTPSTTPTPTPNYCVPPLKVSDLEDAWLAQTRSDLGTGFAWRFWHAEHPGDSSQDFGWILDSSDIFEDRNINADAPVLLSIYQNSRPVDVREGDYVTVEYDGGQTLKIYPPPLSGSIEIGNNAYYYVAEDGSTYVDRELCDLAKAVPSPTPSSSSTPTPIPTATPNRTPTATPSPSPTSKPTATPDITPSPTPSPLPTPHSLIPIIESGDYDGDGTSDVAIFRGASGLWAVRGVTRAYFGSGQDIPASGDYDGDGTADIGIFRGASGLWGIRGVSRAYYGSGSDLPVPGDYDGDGTCDPAIFRGTSGLWAVSGVTRIYFGGSSDQPVPADYSGDGSADVAIFRGASSLWAIRNVSRFYYGGAADQAVFSDFDGDGLPDPGIFRPASGLWGIRGISRAYYGSGSDRTVPADYNGDGFADIAIFRESSGLWAIRELSRIYFGTLGDLPVTR